MNSEDTLTAFQAWKENKKSEECMRLLLAAGANPFKIILLHPSHKYFTECNGKSAAQLAETAGNSVDLLGIPSNWWETLTNNQKVLYQRAMDQQFPKATN